MVLRAWFIVCEFFSDLVLTKHKVENLIKKNVNPKKGDFALDGHEPFMTGTWVRRHGPIFKKV